MPLFKTIQRIVTLMLLMSTATYAAFEPTTCNHELFSPTEDASPFNSNYWAQRALGGVGLSALSDDERKQPITIAYGDQGPLPMAHDAFKGMDIYDKYGQKCSGSGDEDCHGAMVLSVMCSEGQCSMSSPKGTTIFAHLANSENDIDIAKIIDWIVDFNKTHPDDEDIKVVNLSLRGLSPLGDSAVFEPLLKKLAEQDIVVLWAAGNDYEHNADASWLWVSKTKQYPNILPIAALDVNGQTITSFSNYGPWVRLANYGYAVKTHQSNLGGSGTSIATPLTAGIAINVRKVAPSLSAIQTAYLLGATAFDLGDAIKFGHGRPNMVLATTLARAIEQDGLNISRYHKNPQTAMARAADDLVKAAQNAFNHQVIDSAFANSLLPFEEAIHSGIARHKDALLRSQNCTTYSKHIKYLHQRYFLTRSQPIKKELCQFYSHHLKKGNFWNATLIDMVNMCDQFDNTIVSHAKQNMTNDFVTTLLPTNYMTTHKDFKTWMDEMVRHTSLHSHLASLVLSKETVIKQLAWASWVDVVAQNSPLELRKILGSRVALAKAIQLKKLTEWLQQLATADLNLSSGIDRQQRGIYFPVLPYSIFSYETVYSEGALIKHWMEKYAEDYVEHPGFYRPLSIPAAMKHPWWFDIYESLITGQMDTQVQANVINLLSNPELLNNATAEYFKALALYVDKQNTDLMFGSSIQIIAENHAQTSPKNWPRLMAWMIDHLEDNQLIVSLLKNKVIAESPNFGLVIKHLSDTNTNDMLRLKRTLIEDNTWVATHEHKSQLAASYYLHFLNHGSKASRYQALNKLLQMPEVLDTMAISLVSLLSDSDKVIRTKANLALSHLKLNDIATIEALLKSLRILKTIDGQQWLSTMQWFVNEADRFKFVFWFIKDKQVVDSPYYPQLIDYLVKQNSNASITIMHRLVKATNWQAPKAIKSKLTVNYYRLHLIKGRARAKLIAIKKIREIPAFAHIATTALTEALFDEDKIVRRQSIRAIAVLKLQSNAVLWALKQVAKEDEDAKARKLASTCIRYFSTLE